MMKKSNKKSLTLTTHTLRTLRGSDLVAAAGAAFDESAQCVTLHPGLTGCHPPPRSTGCNPV